MASLTALPERTLSDSQNYLHHLPSPNQPISRSDKEPTSEKTFADILRYCFQAHERFLENVLSSERTLRELLQARQIWASKGLSTFYTFETELQLLRSIYSFRKQKEVQSFLEMHRFLAPLLIEAYLEIRKHFPNSQVFLEVDADPEEINDQQLVAFIATNYSPDEALRKLKQLDENWWLDALDRAQRKLCISVEFE